MEGKRSRRGERIISRPTPRAELLRAKTGVYHYVESALQAGNIRPNMPLPAAWKRWKYEIAAEVFNFIEERILWRLVCDDAKRNPLSEQDLEVPPPPAVAAPSDADPYEGFEILSAHGGEVAETTKHLRAYASYRLKGLLKELDVAVPQDVAADVAEVGDTDGKVLDATLLGRLKRAVAVIGAKAAARSAGWSDDPAQWPMWPMTEEAAAALGRIERALERFQTAVTAA